MKNITLVALIVTGIITNGMTQSRPDSHAPLGVMGDHTHSKGEFMASYRYMHMKMDGMRNSDSELTTAEVLTNYMMTPITMSMDMHMVGAMYAPSDKVTIMAMLNYLSYSMDITGMMMMMEMNFSTESSGLGDTQLSVMYRFLKNDTKKIHATLGLRIPTGSIEAKGVTPMSMGNEVILPYPMQVGSGTWGITPGITYTSTSENYSYGAQISSIVRFGDNDRGYTFGNKLMSTAWLACPIANWVSLSARVEHISEGEISGADSALNPMMAPTMNTSNTGGNTVNGALGANLIVPKGTFINHRIAVEYALPLLQDVNGVQMNRKSTLTLGWQYAF